ncbi:MAG: hypothetical protein A4S09_09300 [Proteobacteria bacterium SG_bin7]|nr:MAG: hypothetical protein A4S09_09300 [Proteobacteria bacterium SG_bin7]
MRSLLILLIYLSVALTIIDVEASQCGPDQKELANRANEFLGLSKEPQIPPIAVPPSRPIPPTATNPIPPTRPSTSSPDPRSTGSHYYDRQASGQQLSPREQRQANSYQQSVIETRRTPVNYNTPGIGPAQKQEISQMLDRFGISYNKNNFTIPPSTSTGNNIAFEDRIRKAIYDTMKGPITDINFQMDVLRDRVSSLEAILAEKNAKDQVWKKSKKGGGSNKAGEGSNDRGERMVASIPNAVPPEKAAVNPLDLDQIVNKALYVRDGAHWTKSASLSEKQSKDPISKGGIAKEIYRSYAIPDGTEIRVLELVNTKDEIVGIKIFIFRPDKNTWVPVFYKPDPTTQQFVRQSTYHGDRLPYACINCHGGSLRKMGPQVEMSYWKKNSK